MRERSCAVVRDGGCIGWNGIVTGSIQEHIGVDGARGDGRSDVVFQCNGERTRRRITSCIGSREGNELRSVVPANDGPCHGRLCERSCAIVRDGGRVSRNDEVT